jgi:TBCC domain-containing protein 1
VQIICAARSVCVNTCHDCILYLGANAPPLLLGDNRFLQLAPYNSGYERLAAHMALVGVRPAPNHWDQPLALLPDHRQQPGAATGEAASAPASPSQQWQAAAAAREQAGAGAAPGSPAASQQREAEGEAMELSQQAGGGGGSSAGLAGGSPGPGSPGAGGHLGEEGLPASPVAGAPPAVTVLPPSKLTPFVVPFKGGWGPLCGGPASLSLGIRWVRGRPAGRGVGW